MAALTCVGVMQLKDGREVPVEALTPEELTRCKQSMMERLGRTMSLYFTQHPERYAMFCQRMDERAAEQRGEDNAKQ